MFERKTTDTNDVKLYAIFHLNLFYSSIEEDQRREVIRRCYWPLLRLVKGLGLPIGIEASGYTLELASTIDPAWIVEMRQLIQEGSCEWVGSGYTQLIGPLVPAKVNAKNLQLGLETYERILGVRPKLAFVNEQAYSAGLVRHYLDAGFQAIMMEWENPAHDHPDWDTEWQYFPQLACGIGNERIPLIWNKSFAFQKLQRYVHGDLTKSQYIDYIAQHCTNMTKAFPVYGNDAEIFDFRPGRYEAEAPLHPDGEWVRLQGIFDSLQQDPRFEWVAPSAVLDLQFASDANHSLRLESTANPIPVKKQAKYNVVRWSVTGRDDSQLNALCWRLYEKLKHQANGSPQEWKELCYLWSSDFRTHITQKRWEELTRRIQQMAFITSPAGHPRDSWSLPGHLVIPFQTWSTRREEHLLVLESDTIKLQLNCAKGLAIHGLWVKQLSDCPLIGTLPHGYFQDISMGADYFSGHLVFESPVQPKVTDLCRVEPEVQCLKGMLMVSVIIPSRFGEIRKSLHISPEGHIRFFYKIHWKDVPAGALRLGSITLNPLAFQSEHLELETHNGGYAPEVFPLQGVSVDHCCPVSFLVSANNGFGNTEGCVVLQDHSVQVRVENSQAEGYLIPQLTSHPIAPSYFCRVSFSAMEFDDTTRGMDHGDFFRSYAFSIYASRRSVAIHENERQSNVPKEVVC